MGKGKSLLMEGIKSNEKIVDHEGVLIEEVLEYQRNRPSVVFQVINT